MQFRDFSAFNRRRCEAANGFNHKLGSWSLSDWFTATMGELGEAANVAKKLNRVRDGITGNSETTPELQAALADELGDTFIYLDLLAQSSGIDLEEAVIRKFNRTSAKIGYDNFLGTYPIAMSEIVPLKSDSPPSVGDAIGGGFCAGRHPNLEGAFLIVAGHDSEATKKSWSSAKDHCRNYAGGGFSDWKVPSRAEALLTWEILGAPITKIKSFAKGGENALAEEYYWTDEEYQFASDYAWGQGFGNGRSDDWGKSYELRVRPVRILFI